MSETETAMTTKKDETSEKKKGGYPFKGRRPDKTKKSPDSILVLCVGKGNNFHKFKHALSEATLKEYRNLGKLINLGKYYVHEFSQLNLPPGVMLTSAPQASLELEAMKQSTK
jgi:hypothetical protein